MLDAGEHMAPIKSLTLTPDGKQLVSAGDDKAIRIWVEDGQDRQNYTRAGGARMKARFTPWRCRPTGAGWRPVVGFPARVKESDAIRLYDFATGQLVALFKGHTNGVQGLAFSPDGERLISGSHDKSAIIWDVEGRKLLRRLKGHTDYPVTYPVAFTPDGERAVTGSYDTTLRLWRVSDGVSSSSPAIA
jgi:WD40 repeat protein